MKRFFSLRKHLLYYKGTSIIEHILKNCINANVECFIVCKEDDTETRSLTDNIIIVGKTNNRVETINKSLSYLQDRFETIIAYDCDVLFSSKIISSIDDDMITVSLYKNDGLKYGFVSVDSNLQYKHGNEKQKESEFITTGIYSFNVNRMKLFLKENQDAESMLEYYNVNKPKLIYTSSYTNLGDIYSYFENL
jgi:NDP-sugar pyrophosphorylase family protein